MPASFTGHFCQIVNIAKSKVNPVYIFRDLSHRRRLLNVNTLLYDMAVSYTSAQCSALTGSASDAMGFWAFPQLRLRALARSFLHCPVLSNIYCISSLPHRVLPAIHSAAQPPVLKSASSSPTIHSAAQPPVLKSASSSPAIHSAAQPPVLKSASSSPAIYCPSEPCPASTVSA